MPSLIVWIGVRPQNIAEEPRVGYIGGPVEREDLLDALEIGRYTTVHAEDLLLDDGGDGKRVEAVDEDLPDLDVLFALACVRGGVHSSKKP